MRELGVLIKRNMMVYCKDRGNVFYSLMAMLIVIVLMVVFLGDMNVDSIKDLLKEYGGARNASVDASNALDLVLNWVIAGVVVVNSLTVSLALVGVMIDDETDHRLGSFFISPVNRTKFVFSYVLAAFLMGYIFSVLTVGISEIYMAATGGTLLSLEALLKILVSLLVIEFFTSALVFFVGQFIHTRSAFSGVSTIIGTLAGFLAAIYIPYGTLPGTVQNFLKCVPLFPASSLLRELFTDNVLTTTFDGLPAGVVSEYKEYMGISMTYDGNEVEFGLRLLIVAGSAILLMVLSTLFVRKRTVRDR